MQIEFRRYMNIDKRTLEAIDKVLKKGFFRKSFKKRFELLLILNKELSRIYNVKKAKLHVASTKVANDKKYSSDGEVILIGDRLSIISFLAKFKLYLDSKKDLKDKEVKLDRDCYDWALSALEASNKEVMEIVFRKMEEFLQKEEDKKDEIHRGKKEVKQKDD